MVKKFLISALLVLFAGFGFTARATVDLTEGATPSVEPDVVQIDAQGKGVINYYVDTEETDICTFQFDLYMPAGFMIPKTSRGAWQIQVNNDQEVMVDHAFSVGDHTDEEEPYYRILCYSPNLITVAPGHNRLLSITIQAPADFQNVTTPETCEVKKILFAATTDTKDLAYRPAGFTFTVEPEALATGLEEIVAPDGDEVIYNLNGLRVNRPLAPGIYIINGVKTLVD